MESLTGPKILRSAINWKQKWKWNVWRKFQKMPRLRQSTLSNQKQMILLVYVSNWCTCYGPLWSKVRGILYSQTQDHLPHMCTWLQSYLRNGIHFALYKKSKLFFHFPYFSIVMAIFSIRKNSKFQFKWREFWWPSLICYHVVSHLRRQPLSEIRKMAAMASTIKDCDKNWKPLYFGQSRTWITIHFYLWGRLWKNLMKKTFLATYLSI